MTADGWRTVARLRDVVAAARGNGVTSLSLERLATWLDREISSGDGVALPVAPEPEPVVMDPVGVGQAASLLGVSAQRVRALCASGRLAAVHAPDGTWIIPRAAVLERLSERQDHDRTVAGGRGPSGVPGGEDPGGADGLLAS